MIIVNSPEVMAELDKKSSVYSDRPRLEMGGELVGYSKTIVLCPYGDRFRNYRRYIAKIMGTPKLVSSFNALEEEEMHKLLKRIAETPNDVEQHMRR